MRKPCSTAQALTMCKGERPTLRRAEPRWVFPSMATAVNGDGSREIGIQP
jgi:hypothetical protein